MPTVIATPGTADANSYVTVAEADAYFDTRLNATAWLSAEPAVKERGVIMASRLLDSMYEWDSFPSASTQALQWPRTGLLAANQISFVPNDAIPKELKNAASEFALALIAGGTNDLTANSDVETLGITQLTAGPVSMSFREGVVAKVVPDAVFHALPSWWGTLRSRSSLGGTRELVRA